VNSGSNSSTSESQNLTRSAGWISSLNIRTKIILGILVTGGLALGAVSIFAIAQAAQITDSLSGRLETSTKRLAEEDLVNTVYTEAEAANQSFNDVLDNVEGLAQNWVSLQEQKTVLGQGDYWNATTGLSQFPDGRYGNLPTDVSSLYVPATANLTDSLIVDLNTSAYLDFYAPSIMDSNSSLLAVYAIDTHGVTRYYPNINLAEVLPSGFDPRKRPYYEITSPLFNQKRISRWTIPYKDATGAGLVVTAAAPIYIGNSFNGIVAADMQLSTITQRVESLKVGQTGYAFMIDDAGHIISMPDAGYKLFDLDPDEIKAEEFFKTSVLARGTQPMESVTNRMVAGGNGLVTVTLAGVDNYISFAPVKANGYSLALVVPVAELQTEIIAARSTTQTQIQSAIRLAVVLLLILLLVAVLISLGIGQLIAAPVIRLTEVANAIVSGDLTARAHITSRDEIGSLGQAFNTMTTRLGETLQGLELRVEERTSELKIANQRNERRARQFEAIAQVASTISSTRELDTLLTQVTSAISTRFDFYHVGIFLLDPRKEFAVLSAANSEGGRRMLARQHRLRVGETGIVGFVASTGRPRVALNTGQDAVFFNNPDLPDTRSEIALPLLAGRDVIGVLDVQSTVANAFDQEDISILTTLADEVSIAIQNSLQFDQTRRALAESEALSRQFVHSGWQQFTKSQNLLGIHHTGARATLLYAKNKDEEGNGHTPPEADRPRNRGAVLSLPVKLRGEVIGSVDVRSPDNERWDQDELDVVTAIIERAAIAMENARLLAESQKRAAKERTIGEISAKISAQSDIDQLLKTAAQELNRTLPGAEIAIQFHRSQETE
jgi:GAF domain-containing protein/HAMP domain-containing protein